MRQTNAETPDAEKVRMASFSVTFGFSVRMADVVMMDFRQPASAEVDPQAAHSSKGKPRDLFPLGRRIHHTDADEHGGADDEHQYGIVQEVHVHEPADRSES